VPAKKDYGDGNLRWTSGPGRGGRFAPKGGKAGGKAAPATGPVRPPNPARLAKATDDDVLELFHKVSQRPRGTPGVEETLTALGAELTRREGQVNLQRAQSQRVHDLVDAGTPYLDAWAEVHGRDVRDLEREQRLALIDAQRRPGERRSKTLRRMYGEHVVLSVIQAEEDTRGELLNRAGKAAGIDPASLWEGPDARARKYASRELLEWWSQHGGRMTVALFNSQYTGDKAAAERARGAGRGKDYGG